MTMRAKANLTEMLILIYVQAMLWLNREGSEQIGIKLCNILELVME